MNARILVIDAEAMTRSLVRLFLEFQGLIIFEANSGKEGLAEVATNVPDLILLDLGLPDQSGHDVLKHLREWFTRPIIVLSVHNNSQEIVKALDSGANDYITMPIRPEELVARIKSAIRNFRETKNMAKAEFRDFSIDFGSRTVTKGKTQVKLTPTEYRLLSAMARNESRILTLRYLLSTVWGPENKNDQRHLRTAVENLRKKIETDPNHPSHIFTESGVGYRFIGNGSRNDQRHHGGHN